MGDPLLKRLEIGFRRALLRSLKLVVARSPRPFSKIDFNTCKFLFVRQDMIGDVLVATPLFAALKKHYPAAQLDVLLSSNNHFVVQNDPVITKRWVYRKTLFSGIQVLRNIRRESYDFVIDLMDNPSATSTVFCLLSGSRWNVGIEKQNDFVYDVSVPMLSRRDTHIIERIAQLLTPFGIRPESEEFAVRYFTSPESDTFADAFLRQYNVGNRPIIGINISAGSDVRYWGTHNFRSFVSHVTTTFPDHVVLILYHPVDKQKASSIAESYPQVLLSPETGSFDQFAALIRRLSILLTPDTSAVHLAAAFKIPVVVLYVQSDKSLKIWEPYRTDYEVLVTEHDDLTTIPISQAVSAFDRLLARSHAHVPL